MGEIWVTSDTHFQHQNIIKFCGRPWQTYWEMDEALIENWNKVVKPGDKVYHLGDVYFGSGETAWEILKRLNGKKRLIVGNHDEVKSKPLQHYFEKISLWRQFSEFGLLLTHLPIHPLHIRGDYEGTVNVHGHIHNLPSPEGAYKCVCVEQTNYTPVNIETLRVK